MKPTLLVLAAGMGSRYGGLKQIDPVGPNGETIIDYSIYDAIQAGFGKVVFVIRRDIEDAFRNFLGDRLNDHIEVAFAFQELDALPEGFSVPQGRTKPWGTGHAILVAKDEVNTPCLVINGDDFYGRESFAKASEYLIAAKDETMADYSMVAYQLCNTLSDFGSVSRGICTVSEQQHLMGVEEFTKISKTGISITHQQDDGSHHEFSGQEATSMNMFGFTPSIFEHLEKHFVAFLESRSQEEKSELYIPAVVNQLIQEKLATCTVIPTSEQWFGVTYREDREHVCSCIQKLISSGVYPEKLF
jgi:dTDP-glucose pyrophosphorylase